VLSGNGRGWVICILSTIGSIRRGIAAYVARVVVVVGFPIVGGVAGCTVGIAVAVWVRLDVVVVDLGRAAARSGRRAHVVFHITIGSHGLRISRHVLLRVCALLTWRPRIVLFGSIIALLTRVGLYVLDRAAWRGAGGRVGHGTRIAEARVDG
jgi:hypothetical protein